MGVDFPDFQQTSITNVVLQEIAELTSRQKDGNVEQETYDDTVTALLGVSLVWVTGKGVIYGGWVASYDGTMSHKDDQVTLDFDHEALGGGTFKQMMDYGITQQPGGFGALSMYDDTNFVYSQILPYGIIFEDGFRLWYINTVADDVEVMANITFALL